MEIHRYVAELLSAHDCVIIPGLGGFVSSYLPAQIHPVYHTFQPPSKKVLFNVNLRQNDGLLANLIVQSEQVSFSVANDHIVRFAEETLKSLKTRKYLILPQIGKLYMGREGNIQFDQDLRSNHLSESFGLEPFFSAPVSRDPHQEKQAKRELATGRDTRELVRKALPKPLKWAAILAVPLAVATILSLAGYDSIKNGSWNTANILSSLSPFSHASRSDHPAISTKVTPVPETPAERLMESPAESPSDILSDRKQGAARGPVIESVPAESDRQSEIVPSKPEPSPVQTTSFRYAVIAGAFGVPQNADNLVRQLTKQGYQATILVRTGRGLTRVAAGVFETESEALRMMNTLKSSGYPGAWVFEKE